MPKGRLARFGVPLGDFSIIADGGDAGTCVPIAMAGRAGSGLLNEDQRLECERHRHEGRRSSVARSTRRIRTCPHPQRTQRAAGRPRAAGFAKPQSHQTETH